MYGKKSQVTGIERCRIGGKLNKNNSRILTQNRCKKLKKSIVSILLLVSILASTLTIGIAVAQPFEEARVIVGFKGRPDASLIRTHGWKINQEYQSLSAIACSLPKHAIEALKNNPLIAYVEEDIQVDAIDAELTASWGVERIGAATVWATNPGNQGD